MTNLSAETGAAAGVAGAGAGLFLAAGGAQALRASAAAPASSHGARRGASGRVVETVMASSLLLVAAAMAERAAHVRNRSGRSPEGRSMTQIADSGPLFL